MPNSRRGGELRRHCHLLSIFLGKKIFDFSLRPCCQAVICCVFIFAPHSSLNTCFMWSVVRCLSFLTEKKYIDFLQINCFHFLPQTFDKILIANRGEIACRVRLHGLLPKMSFTYNCSWLSVTYDTHVSPCRFKGKKNFSSRTFWSHHDEFISQMPFLQPLFIPQS